MIPFFNRNQVIIVKRIIFIFILAFFFFAQSPLYIQYNRGELETLFNSNCSYIDIKSTGNIKSISEFSDAVTKFCDEENAFIATLSYNSQADKSKTTELFVEGDNIPKFLKNKGLTSDMLTGCLSEDVTVDLSLFNPMDTCIVQNFKQLEDKSLSRMYYIYPAEKRISFQHYMTENYNVAFFTADELLYIQTEYIDQLPGLALMMAALLVFFAFWIVTQYQANAVKKLHGYSDRKNILWLFGQFTFLGFGAFAASVIVQFVFCGLYNQWESYWNILWDTLQVCIPIFIGLISMGLLFSLLFYSSDVKYALKGRKPYHILNCCAIVLKIFTIIFLCNSIINIGVGMTQTNNILKQEENFRKVSDCRFTEIGLATGSSDYMSQYETKGSNFYRELDGILISDRNISHNRGDLQKNVDDILSNTVFINSNYLTINPIYNLSGTLINIDESIIQANEAIVLVPEKYKKYENELYQNFNDWYQFAKYVTIPTTELPPEKRTVKLQILFVENEQTYFAFNTDESDLNYNNIEDPFAFIVTKENMDDSYYSVYLTNGEYLLFDNTNQSLEKILRIADDTKLSEEIVNVPTVSSAIDTLMQQCKNQIALSSACLILTILIVFLISIYIIKNLMEQYRKLFFTKKMLGYPMFGIYGKFIMLIILFQLILFGILKVALDIPLNWWLLVCCGFQITDFMIMFITALKYQNTLTQSALKGEAL